MGSLGSKKKKGPSDKCLHGGEKARGEDGDEGPTPYFNAYHQPGQGATLCGTNNASSPTQTHFKWL